MFSITLLLLSVLLAQDSHARDYTRLQTPATDSDASIGANRPDELIGKWELVISGDEADTTRVLKFDADGRFVYSEKTTTHESLRQNLIREWGADPARVQSVADSLAALKSRFHDALVADKQVFVIELTGPWGVEEYAIQINVIQIVVDSFSLSFNGLQGNDISEFYETIIPLVVPAENAELADFFLQVIAFIRETFDALIEEQAVLEMGRYSIENDNLVLVQGEDTFRYLRVSETITPDFDGDGTVGFPDFLLFAAQFGSSQGDARYDARFDLDGDGTIGFGDFLIFVNAFGK